MTGCFPHQDEVLNCTCSCHSAKNNLGCLNCKCKPVLNGSKFLDHMLDMGNAIDKLKAKINLIECSLNKISSEHFNIVGRLNNIATDMKDAFMRIRELEEHTICPKCKGKGIV